MSCWLSLCNKNDSSVYLLFICALQRNADLMKSAKDIGPCLSLGLDVKVIEKNFVYIWFSCP